MSLTSITGSYAEPIRQLMVSYIYLRYGRVVAFRWRKAYLQTSLLAL